MATTHAGNQAPAPVDRATIVAELEALTDAAEPSPQGSPTAPAATTTAGEAVVDPVATPPAATASPADPPDAETQKRLSVIQRAEERQRQAIAAERTAALAEIEKARAELAPLRDQVERLNALKARAKYEPDAVIEELLGEAIDYDYASKRFFAKSKAAKDKPEHAHEVAKAAKEREHEDRLARIERENRELREQMTARQQQAQLEADRARYLEETVKLASDETPLLAQLATKNPDKAREKLWEIAVAIHGTTGDIPEAAELALAYEKQRRAELEELGIDVATIAPKKKPAAAAPARPTTALPAAPSGATPVPKKQTRDELLADTLRILESGEIPAD